MVAGITIRANRQDDFKAWGKLWQKYCDFYEESVPPVVTEHTWGRLLAENETLFGFVAEDEAGTLVGFTNCVVHPGTWSRRDNCYLEDLFVSADVRGKGVGRALIEAVVAKSRELSCSRVYWQTHNQNTNARALYDKITPVSNWVIYEIPN